MRCFDPNGKPRVRAVALPGCSAQSLSDGASPCQIPPRAEKGAFLRRVGGLAHGIGFDAATLASALHICPPRPKRHTGGCTDIQHTGDNQHLTRHRADIGA